MAAPGTRTDTAAKGRIITGRHALSVPFDDYSLAEHADIAREAESLGYTDAWSYEVDGTDCFAPLAAIAGASAMRLGTAIANVYTRAPATLAQTAAGIAELAPGRFNLGIGSGSSVIVDRRPAFARWSRSSGLPSPASGLCSMGARSRSTGFAFLARRPSPSRSTLRAFVLAC